MLVSSVYTTIVIEVGDGHYSGRPVAFPPDHGTLFLNPIPAVPPLANDFRLLPPLTVTATRFMFTRPSARSVSTLLRLTGASAQRGLDRSRAAPGLVLRASPCTPSASPSSTASSDRRPFPPSTAVSPPTHLPVTPLTAATTAPEASPLVINAACVICLAQIANTVLRPCNHLVICSVNDYPTLNLFGVVEV